MHQRSITVRLRIMKEDEKDCNQNSANEESSPESRDTGGVPNNGNATAVTSAMAESTNHQQQQEEEPAAAIAILNHETDPQDKNVSTVVPTATAETAATTTNVALMAETTNAANDDALPIDSTARPTADLKRHRHEPSLPAPPSSDVRRTTTTTVSRRRYHHSSIQPR